TLFRSGCGTDGPGPWPVHLPQPPALELGDPAWLYRQRHDPYLAECRGVRDLRQGGFAVTARTTKKRRMPALFLCDNFFGSVESFAFGGCHAYPGACAAWSGFVVSLSCPGHAVNTSLYARVRHPCRTRSRTGKAHDERHVLCQIPGRHGSRRTRASSSNQESNQAHAIPGYDRTDTPHLLTC